MRGNHSMDLATNLKKVSFSESLGVKLGLFLCAVLLSLSVSTSSFAQPTSPCDPEYMDALEARAWLEAQREISQNQNFIYKPDSVLEYTCFDYFLNEAASNFDENRQFSETDRWDDVPVGFTDFTTDEALEQVVFEPLITYLTSNFNTIDFNAGAYLNNRTEEEYEPQDLVDGDIEYECEEMQKVWNIARCSNFNPNEQIEFDGFYDFLYYEDDGEPRQESENWELMCEEQDPRFAQARVTAFNEDQDLFDVTDENIEAEGNGAPYLEDDIVTHLDWILPSGDCIGTVPTGITIQRPDLGTFDEIVCTNPGCSSNGAGGCD